MTFIRFALHLVRLLCSRNLSHPALHALHITIIAAIYALLNRHQLIAANLNLVIRTSCRVPPSISHYSRLQTVCAECLVS